MRADTGRDMIIKIEGTYHGHHDSLMFSVIPDPGLIGPREHPVTVPQVLGIPQAFAELVRRRAVQRPPRGRSARSTRTRARSPA